jgi:hypothetical protein
MGSKIQDVAIKMFFFISKKWELTEEEEIILLGSPCEIKILKLGQTGSVDDEMLARISHITVIYKRLHTLFEDPDTADSWIRRSNQYFDGKPAIEVMKTDLKVVRDYLSHQVH